jgi:DNA-binding NtrC family response regulator
MNYEWPGNVRELENAVEYSTNMAFGEIIGLDDVPMRLKKAEESLPKTLESSLILAEQVKEFEREVILKKFKKYNGGGDAKETVARELGLSRATLYRKLAELDINKKLL